MCIIIAKKSGIPMPKEEIISNCWQANSDGAGFMYLKNKRVRIEKGFMKLKALKKALKFHNFGLKDTVILHFRWATHGSVTPANTHPFPASNDIKKLRNTITTTDTGIAHNGILTYDDDFKNDLSDTMTFIRDIFSDKLILDSLENPAIKNLIEPIVKSSKFALLSATGIQLIGKFIDDNGLLYSNNGYKDDPFEQYYAINKNYARPYAYEEKTRCPHCNELVSDYWYQHRYCTSCYNAY